MEYITDDEYRQMTINNAVSNAKKANEQIEELTNIIRKIRGVLYDCDNCLKIKELEKKLEQGAYQHIILFSEYMDYKEVLEYIMKSIEKSNCSHPLLKDFEEKITPLLKVKVSKLEEK